MPQIGHRYERYLDLNVRILLYGHYRIAYLIKENGDIDILGILHGALDIDRYLSGGLGTVQTLTRATTGVNKVTSWPPEFLMEISQNTVYAVIAESKDYEKELYLHNLSFAQLMDDVVVPYESDESFFIDGVPVKKETLKRIKIVRQNDSFQEIFNNLHHFLRVGSSSSRHVPAKDYPVRLAAIFREAGDDVTSQVIKAYDLKIRPSIKDYLPKREELINAALQIFMESIKLMAKNG